MTFEGTEMIASKETPFPGFFAQRSRLAIAFSASIGAFLQLVVSGYRGRALSNACWHHTTSQQIAQKLAPYPYVIAGDVKNFDQNMDPDMVAYIMQAFGEGWAPGISEMLQTSVTAPILINEDRVGGPGRWKWTGDPRDPRSYTVWRGYPSGVPTVSDTGKMIGLFLDLIPCLDLGMLALEDLPQVLACQHSKFTCLNSGDDFVMGFTHKADLEEYAKYLADNKHPYFDIGIEEPASFLGNLICLNRGVVVAVPNVLSYALNMFGRERGIDSRFTPYWAYGYRMKKKHYGTHPGFFDVDRVVQQVAKKHLGKSLDDLIPDAAPPMGLDTRSFYDAMFIEDPDRIHYKFSADQVSPELLAQIYLNVPVGTVTQILGRWRIS